MNAPVVKTGNTLLVGGRWRMLRQAAGLLMLAVGLAGMIVPLFPGLPLLLGGAALLAPNHRLVRLGREPLRTWLLRRDLAALLLVTFSLAVGGPVAPARAGIDEALKDRIQEQASGDKRLAGTQVVVRVQKRGVILSGKVRLYLQKMIYEQITWRTQGVREVDNEIRVVPEAPATDDEIKAIIIRFLIEHELLRGTELTIEVHKGRVFLSGSFREPEDVLTLKHRVAQIEGVVAIEIDVKTFASYGS